MGELFARKNGGRYLVDVSKQHDGTLLTTISRAFVPSPQKIWHEELSTCARIHIAYNIGPHQVLDVGLEETLMQDPVLLAKRRLCFHFRSSEHSFGVNSIKGWTLIPY